MKRHLLMAAMLVLAAGCASLARLETPQLSIVGAELVKSSLFEQRLKVRMRVQNPNDRALPVKGLSYRLELDGEEFAEGVSAQSFEVAAFGETEFDMNVTTNVASALVKLLARGGDLSQAVDYRIVGKVALAEGFLRSIPFEEKGSLELR